MAYRGTYKGRPFRSLMEYSFYRHLERNGTPIDDIGYESLRIPYVFGKRVRTYILDFVVGSEVYEVKPTCRQKGRKFDAKTRAAREFCEKNELRFSVVSERDFKIFTLKEARSDQDVTVVLGRKRKRRKRR